MKKCLGLMAALALASCTTVEFAGAGPSVTYACSRGGDVTIQRGQGDDHIRVDFQHGDKGRTEILGRIDSAFGERFGVNGDYSFWINGTQALFETPEGLIAFCQQEKPGE